MENLHASALPTDILPLGYYKHFPADFNANLTVRQMSYTCQGIYRALLDIQWQAGTVQDFNACIKMLRLTLEEAEEFEPYYQTLFPNGQNPELARQREESVAFIKAQRERSKAGVKARANQVVDPVVDQVVNQSVSPTPTPTATTTVSSDNKLSSDIFRVPNVSEVTEFMTSRGWKQPDRKAEQFIAFYDSKGWKIGKAKMKSWKSAVITWEGRMTDDDFVPKPKPKEPIEGIDYQILPSGLEVTLDGRYWCIDTWRKENGL